jgi:hypothetical protein
LRVLLPGSLVFADLVAYHAADRCTAYGSGRTAAGKHGAAHGADSGADRSALVPLRHFAATTQAKQHCQGSGTGRKSMHFFHWNISFSNFSYETIYLQLRSLSPSPGVISVHQRA